MIGSPGPCCMSSSTGLDASVPRVRIHWVVPPMCTGSSVSMCMSASFGSWLRVVPQGGDGGLLDHAVVLDAADQVEGAGRGEVGQDDRLQDRAQEDRGQQVGLPGPDLPAALP